MEFRWSGNKVFHAGTANDNVGNVYKTYLTGNMAVFYSASDAKPKKNAKHQLSMALELYIDKLRVC